MRVLKQTDANEKIMQAPDTFQVLLDNTYPKFRDTNVVTDIWMMATIITNKLFFVLYDCLIMAHFRLDNSAVQLTWPVYPTIKEEAGNFLYWALLTMKVTRAWVKVLFPSL